jgi:hypothetical protein
MAHHHPNNQQGPEFHIYAEDVNLLEENRDILIT